MKLNPHTAGRMPICTYLQLNMTRGHLSGGTCIMIHMIVDHVLSHAEDQFTCWSKNNALEMIHDGTEDAKWI
jgi:predicted DNA-binding protein